ARPFVGSRDDTYPAADGVNRSSSLTPPFVVQVGRRRVRVSGRRVDRRQAQGRAAARPCALRRRRLSGAGWGFLGGSRSVLGGVLREQLLLPLVPGEADEDERGAEKNRDDSGGVGPLVPLEERRLRSRRDLARVLRVLLRDRLRAVERLR